MDNRFDNLLTCMQFFTQASSPFEFNPSWLEEFQNLVWNNCKSYDANLGDSECAQLANSLKIIEEKVVTWAAENYKNRDKVLTSNRHRK